MAIQTIPFIEIVERLRRLAREKASNESVVRDVVNTVYTKDIPRESDWSFLKSTSAISCLAEATTGVVSVNTQNTNCWFSSGLTLESSMTGRKIKFSGNNNIYDLTFVASNSGSISPPLSGEANIGSGGFVIFKDTFSLASDFDRFPVNGGLLFYSAGIPTPLPEKVDDDWYADFAANPSSEPGMCRLYQPDTAGNTQVQVNPPPQDPIVIPYEYLKALTPMKFTTGGTAVMSTASTIVTGTGTYFTKMTTGDYFRINAMGIGADSDWYRINTISSDTNLTLSSNFRSDTSGAFSYTISSAPQYPYKLQDGIINGSMVRLLVDQNDSMFQFYQMQYAKVINDNKKLYSMRMASDDIELIAEDQDYRR